MSMPAFELLRPERLDDALELLARHRHNLKIVAGGTDLIVSMKQGLFAPRYLLDIKGIRDLVGIAQLGSAVRLGALTTIAQLCRSELLRRQYPLLASAARHVSGPNLQFMGTLGGNICLDTRCYWYNQGEFWRQACGYCLKKDGDVCHVAPAGKVCWAVASGDLAPALIALEAEVSIVGPRGRRRVPVSEFYIDEGSERYRLDNDEVVAEVVLPARTASYGGSYQKFRLRGSVDYPLVGVAAAVKCHSDGTVADARLALTAVNPAPRQVPGIDQILCGRPLAEEVLEECATRALKVARPLRTSASTMEYRRHMVGVLVKRALREAARVTNDE